MQLYRVTGCCTIKPRHATLLSGLCPLQTLEPVYNGAFHQMAPFQWECWGSLKAPFVYTMGLIITKAPTAKGKAPSAHS